MIKKIWESWSTAGIKIPFILDPVEKKPSVTLVFPCITFAIACISVIALHVVPSLMPATLTAIVFWALATVLYLIRKVTKMKVNLRDKSVDIENEDESHPPLSCENSKEQPDQIDDPDRAPRHG